MGYLALTSFLKVLSVYLCSYYHEDSQGNQKRNQTSIFRTNCMDCLDRTNVVQSAVAKDILTLQLKEAGIIGAEDTINEDVGFIYLFRKGE